AMKFFSAKTGLTPAEEEDGSGAPGNQLVRKHSQDAWAHKRVDILPANIAGLLFHDPKARIVVRRPDASLFQETEHVDFARELGGFGFENSGAFDGDEVNNLSKIEMIKAMNERAEIGGDGALRCEFMQQIRLHSHKLHDGITAKPAPVEHERGIMDSRGAHRHRHFVPACHHLAPVAQPHEV